MIINVTSIRLRSLWNFFALSYHGLLISRQAKTQPGFVRMKNRGFGYDHYTLSVWESEEALRQFARSGAHLDAMKKSGQLASEIRTYSYAGGQLPSWNEVKGLLREKGRIFKY